MAIITSAKRGYWNQTTTWVDGVVPVDGDSVIIAEGHTVNLNVDMSSFPNGLAALTVNGDLGFQEDIETCLKMNGNINGSGKLFVAYVDAVSSLASVEYFAQHPTYENVYYSVDFDGETFYGVAVNVNSFIEEVFEGDFIYTEVNSLEEVNQTPGTYMVAQDSEGYEGIYINPLSGELPDGEFSIVMSCIRPVEGAEYLSYLLFNSSGTINVPTFHGYGWYPEKEYTTISEDVSRGQNQIPLTEDMGLQPGDIILVGSGEVNGQLSEAAGGKYTVQSYDVPTKTITLTANLQTNRLAGDYVAYLSRTIKLARSSGTGSLILSSSKIDNITLKGVNNATGYFYIYSGDPPYPKDMIIDHCTSMGRMMAVNCLNVSIYNSTALYYFVSSSEPYLENCIGLNVACITYGQNGVIKDCVSQNIGMALSPHNFIEGCIFKNSSTLLTGGYSVHTVKNCVFEDIEILPDKLTAYNLLNNLVNCEFKEGCQNLFGSIQIERIVNCLFDESVSFDFSDVIVNVPQPSYDHNQIVGNYKAWCKGGNIETDFDGEVCLIGRLIFNCQSAEYSVFRDFPVLLPGYRTQRWQALANKSFTGGEVKMELIDPSSDLLIDPTAAPLASYSLPDESETNLPLKLGYKSDKAMMAILRISAKNASGTVEVDTRLIENRVNYGH